MRDSDKDTGNASLHIERVRSMSDQELGELLLEKKSSTIEIYEAARRLKERPTDAPR